MTRLCSLLCVVRRFSPSLRYHPPLDFVFQSSAAGALLCMRMEGHQGLLVDRGGLGVEGVPW